jgi:hypothetical protein
MGFFLFAHRLLLMSVEAMAIVGIPGAHVKVILRYQQRKSPHETLTPMAIYDLFLRRFLPLQSNNSLQ